MEHLERFARVFDILYENVTNGEEFKSNLTNNISIEQIVDSIDNNIIEKANTILTNTGDYKTKKEELFDILFTSIKDSLLLLDKLSYLLEEDK